MNIEAILKYFPSITEEQKKQYGMLFFCLYAKLMMRCIRGS